MCVFFHLWRTLANTFVILRDVYMQKTCNKTCTFSDQTSKLEKKVQLFGVLGDFLTIILSPTVPFSQLGVKTIQRKNIPTVFSLVLITAL